MNVLLVTDAFPPGAGGSGRSTAALGVALARRGHRVRVAVGRSAPRGQTEWGGLDVDEIPLPAGGLGSASRRRSAFAEALASAREYADWELVHAQHWLSAGAASEALPRLPLVVTVRDYWPVCVWSTRLSGSDPCPGCTYARRVVCVGRRHPLLWPVAPALPPLVGAELRERNQALERARGVIAVSRYVASTLEGVGARVIPNVAEPLAADPDRPANVPERYVLFVGKLEPNKAPDALLPILEAARCELPLLVAGSGSLEPRLRDEARRSGHDVRFLGWVEESRALALVKHAEAVVFPSRWQEPLSRVLLDGLALGAVLVVEPTGGTEDLVADEESGLVGRGTNELGRALRRVLDDPALAARLREGAKRRARERFSEAVVLPRVEALYREAAGSS